MLSHSEISIRSSARTRRCQRLLGEQQHAGAAELDREGVLALGAVDRGRLEQLPAVEDRLRIDPRRAPPGRPDREVDVGVDAVLVGADPRQHRAGDHLRTDPDRAVGAERGRVIDSLVGAEATALVDPIRQRVEPRPDVLAVDRDALLAAGRHHDQATLADDPAKLRVGVAVAVGVAQDDEAAEPIRLAALDDDAVVDGDDRCILGGEDVDPATGRRGGDHLGGVAVCLALLAAWPASAPPALRCRRRNGRRRRPGSAPPRSARSASRPGRPAACRRRARRAAPPARTSRRGCRRRSRRRGPRCRPPPSGSWPRRRSRRPGCRGPCARRRWRRPRRPPSWRG